jgi:hypothetical protein
MERDTEDIDSPPAATHTCQHWELYRVHRRFYESALRVVNLYPYICESCGVRALMFGRFDAVNWRWRRVRVRIIFRLTLAGGGWRRRFNGAQPVTIYRS